MMQFQYSPYIVPLILAALILGWVAAYSWSRRANRGALALTLLASAVAEWAIGYALEIAGANLPTKIFWGKMQYVGIVLVPLMWVGFAFHNANRAKWLTFRVIAFLLIIPAITLFLVLTTESNHLVWKEIGIVQSGSFSALGVTYGFWFWIHTAYSYLLLLVGTVIVIRSIGQMTGIYRGQAAVLLMAVLAPWIGNIIYLSGLSPVPKLDLTPFAFTITVVAFTWGIFGFQLVDLSPIARSTVIDEMSTGMIVLDKQNRIVDINPAALKSIGFSGSQILGKDARDILGRWPDLVRKYTDVTEAADEITFGEGAEQQWYELLLSPLHDIRHGDVGRVVTLTNITDRKRAEQLLIETKEHYRQIVESASDMIYRADSKGYITYINPSGLYLMGFGSEAELIGRHYLEMVAPYMRQELKRFYDKQFITKEKNTYFEFTALNKENREIWLGQNVQIIEENSNIVGFQAVARDITELKRTQKALSLARDQALEASRLKSQLLTKVSHELRTPLGGILGYAELMQINAFGSLTENQKMAIAQIIDSTHYLTDLVNDLLDEAQIEAKTVRLAFDPFSPEKLLYEIVANMSILAKNKNLEIVAKVDPSLPETLYGDEKRLHEILLNLVGNAIKFTDQGRVTIQLSRRGPDMWAIEVKDTGIGIPKEAREYIFEPFRQVDSANVPRTRGTGLGLSIVKQLVDLMNGKLELESTIGAGSKFTVILPIVTLSGFLGVKA